MAELPALSTEQVLKLETAFPHRCYSPKHESLEEHMKYAGKVELIAQLRSDLLMRKDRERLGLLMGAPVLNTTHSWEEGQR